MWICRSHKKLKKALKHGLVLKKVHRAISFNQDEWLKPYIEINNKLRTKNKLRGKKWFWEKVFQINE